MFGFKKKKAPFIAIKKFDIIPLKFFNGIEFGTNRQVIWQILGKPKKVCKEYYAKREWDFYETCGLYYDENYNLIAVEIFMNVNSNIEVYYNNERIPNELSEAVEYLKNKCSDLSENWDECLMSKDNSICLGFNRDENKITSILFGIKDYYTNDSYKDFNYPINK